MMVVVTIRVPFCIHQTPHFCSCFASASSRAPPFCPFHPFSLASPEPVCRGDVDDELSETSGVGSIRNDRDGDACCAAAARSGQCFGGHARFRYGHSGMSVADSHVQSSGESAPPHPHRVPGGLPTELTIMCEESSVRALPQAKSEPGKSRNNEPPKSSSSHPPLSED